MSLFFTKAPLIIRNLPPGCSSGVFAGAHNLKKVKKGDRLVFRKSNASENS